MAALARAQDIITVERDLNWHRSVWDGVSPIGHHLEVISPVPLSEICNGKAPTVDVAHCTYHGWQQYESQRWGGEDYIAELAHKLRLSDFNKFAYPEMHHRLIAGGTPGTFSGTLIITGRENVTCANQIEFLRAGLDVTARVIQRRSDDKNHPLVIAFKCIMS